MSSSMQTLYQSLAPAQDEKDGNSTLFFNHTQDSGIPPSIAEPTRDDSTIPSFNGLPEFESFSEPISKAFDFSSFDADPLVTPQPWLELKIDTDDSVTEDEDPQLSPLTTAGLSRALSLPPSLLDEISVGKPRKEVISISTANPSHLFWVPASQHPEIAPAEFEKYVRAHGSAHRRQSRVKRRKSILSVSFTPDDQDQEDEITEDGKESLSDRQAALEILESQTFRRTSVGRSTSTENDDASERKARLRRSISLQLPSVRDQSEIPNFLVFDRNSTSLDESPILVPKADRPLFRRGARTKFQRNSSLASSSTSLSLSSSTSTGTDQLSSKGRWQNYRQSASAYPLRSIDSSEPVPPGGVTLMDRPVQLEEPEKPLVPETSQSCDSIMEKWNPSAEPATAEVQALSVTHDEEEKEESRRLARSNTTTGVPGRSERKSTWSWAFWSDEKSKKSKADGKNELREPSEELEKPTLTDASKTPSIDSSSNNHHSNNSSSNNNNKRFVLSSLFSRKSSSSSKSSSTEPSSSAPIPPKDFQLNKINQNRLPIHVERAIYRMSHIKLANPRRPLQEQVLISNLMFWYLSIISSQQTQASSAAGDSAHDMMQQKNARMVVAASKKKKRLVRKDRPTQGRSGSTNVPGQKGQGKSKDSGPLLQQYMGGSRESTGFVIPENYLRPQPGNHSKNKLSNGMDGRRSSLDDDESDDDEEANEVDESDSSEDEVFSKKSAVSSPKSRPVHKKGMDGTNKAGSSPIQRQNDEDDLPLAMYRKEKR
ncbi:hypothetical protein EC973_006719 [Apophysomyces ossiformis]|uniref:Protein Zds1 C-terminal domain-containing protein n=1 Tax=Apophysomyces ossiformis TaxID=679940 RepID=A0A8H7BQC5_9FUNG|nr:hypothetical protein EC973_006719 [Apophysomyces ossiformis]